MPGARARVFSREFKEAAVRRIVAGEKVKALAAELHVWPKLLYHWWDRYEGGGRERGCRPPVRRDRRSGPTARGQPKREPASRSRRAGRRRRPPRRNAWRSWSARSASRRWSWIFSREPCGTSRRRPERTTGVAPERLHRDRGDDAAARLPVDRTPVCARRCKPGHVLSALASGRAAHRGDRAP